jgi:ABC-type branched-subunit amino acid transport system substrate-binding protein
MAPRGSARLARARPFVVGVHACTRLFAFALLAGTSCSSPDLEGMAFSCEVDSDCLAGRVCGSVDGARTCIAKAQLPIQIGMTGPFRGPSADLGVELRRGILAQFERTNQSGGVFGRRLQLSSLNDNYDPELALANVTQLLDIRELTPDATGPDVRGPNGVFALLGSVGTPTTLLTAPITNKNGVLLFSPFTGAHHYLRDGTLPPYVYNFRPGYLDEAEVIVDYMASQRQPRIISTPPGESYRRLLVFTQNDSYGDAGYAGVVAAYNRRAALPQPDSELPEPSIARVRYEREDLASVTPAIQGAQAFLSSVLANSVERCSVGIVMIDTYQPGNKLIRAIKDWINADALRAERLDVLFSHVSFVGSDALAQALTSAPEDYPDVRDASGLRRLSYADGVLVTQVVPSYTSEATGVSSYRADIDRFDGGAYGFTSLEGYLSARLFVEALLLNGPELSSDALRQTLDTQLRDVDLGIGAKLGFSAIDHQASHTVWGSIMQADGSFAVPFAWARGEGLRPN